MTPQKAVKELKRQVECWKNGTSFAYSLPPLKVAISALEKQIPKKPKILKVHYISNYKYGECQCGEHIMDDDNYCSNCGQKIDWGEIE